MDRWIVEQVTEGIKKAVDRDRASLSAELAERLLADAEKAGLTLDDLEPEFAAPSEMSISGSLRRQCPKQLNAI